MAGTREKERELFARVVGELPDDEQVEWWAHLTKVEMARRRQSEAQKRRWARERERKGKEPR